VCKKHMDTSSVQLSPRSTVAPSNLSRRSIYVHLKCTMLLTQNRAGEPNFDGGGCEEEIAAIHLSTLGPYNARIAPAMLSWEAFAVIAGATAAA
jgi:hypothetical protein